MRVWVFKRPQGLFDLMLDDLRGPTASRKMHKGLTKSQVLAVVEPELVENERIRADVRAARRGQRPGEPVE